MVAGGPTLSFSLRARKLFWCKPSPSIKVRRIPDYERMIEDMDINAGEILNGRACGTGRGDF